MLSQAPTRAVKRVRRRHGIRALWRRFLTDRRGAILAETAILVPILVGILFSGFEVGRFALLQQKLGRTAVTMSDLVAMTKTTINYTQIDNLYDAAGRVMAPFDLAQDGVVIVSAVLRSGANTNVVWQCIGGGNFAATSVLGSGGGTATLPSGFTMTDGEVAIFAEVVYGYQPFVAPDLIGVQTLRHQAVFRPRTGTLEVLLPGPVSPGAPTCVPTP